MLRRLIIGAAVVVALLLVAAWLSRFRVATAMVDRRLAAAHVPASYRLTRIGPFLERMEHVRIGDPGAPDLIAKRIDVTIGYDLDGPVVRGIRVDGVRLRAGLGANGIRLGTIDRLLPATRGGAPGMPDLYLSLNDARLVLDTPGGVIRADLSGSGNPQRRFAGTAQVVAPAIRVANCVARGITADLRIQVRQGAPSASGPMRLTQASCPGLVLGAGTADLTLASNRAFDRVTGSGRVHGFAGQAGPARFAGMLGTVQGTRSAGLAMGTADLALRRLAFPAEAAAVARYAPMLDGTPLAPVARQANAGLVRLLGRSNVELRLAGSQSGSLTELRLQHAELQGADGTRVSVAERDGLVWTERGWRIDADATTRGGSLPALALYVRQDGPGAMLTGTAALTPYPAENSQLAATPIRFTWDGGRGTADTVLSIDGPVGSGFVRGLTLPLRGTASAGGALAIDRGCQQIGFAELRLESFTFGPAETTMCGAPVFARTGDGRVGLNLRTGAIRMAGYTTAGAPALLTTAGMRLDARGFAIRSAAAQLGDPAQPTRLTVASLSGSFAAGTIGGSFTGADGAIGSVPLVVTDADGRWTFAGSALRLAGTLGVRDTAAPARFNPLVTDDAELSLDGGAIAATATLREPATHIEVAAVDLRHDLSSGTGHARLIVPGIAFAPKALQPEALTPLTLGVIANVSGTISGRGRIDWSPRGVTSGGTFGTDRLDLAAAFGPVTGIKGQLRLTDLLGLVSAPRQEATIAEVNPGVAVTNGVVHYQLIGQNRVRVEDAAWPFAAGTLRLDPTTLAFGAASERYLTFRLAGVDAAAFVQQLEFPNISATGTFDGVLPMIFDEAGGRIDAGSIAARPGGGTLAYVGELSNARLGTMGKLAFDALKAIRYSALDIGLDGRLDGEMVSRVRFTGVRQATPDQTLVTRLIRNLPFRFNITVRAPFRGLIGSARAYMDPRLLLTQPRAPPTVQPSDSGPVR